MSDSSRPAWIENGNLRLFERVLSYLNIVIVLIGSWGLSTLHNLDTRMGVMEKWMEIEANHSDQMDKLLTETVTKWAEGQIDLAQMTGNLDLIRQRLGQLERVQTVARDQ